MAELLRLPETPQGLLPLIQGVHEGETSVVTSSSMAASETRKEDFRRYLDRAGVLDVLTSVIVGLYDEPEKPNNAIDFIKHHLCSASQDYADMEALKLEVEQLKTQLENLQEINSKLRATLQKYEPLPDEEQTADHDGKGM